MPFKKGQSGNPGGRPKKTTEELDLVAACREKSRAALDVIEQLSTKAKNEAVRLKAAITILERAYGPVTPQQAGQTPEETMARALSELIGRMPS